MWAPFRICNLQKTLDVWCTKTSSRLVSHSGISIYLNPVIHGFPHRSGSFMRRFGLKISPL
jgi:hypothetical protein